MTRDDDKKPPRRDPFAPLPLAETLTGKTSRESSSTSTPTASTPVPTPTASTTAPTPAATASTTAPTTASTTAPATVSTSTPTASTTAPTPAVTASTTAPTPASKPTASTPASAVPTPTPPTSARATVSTPTPTSVAAPSIQPEPAAPLPPSAFTPRVTGEHEAPIVPFDASAYEPEPAYDAPEPAYQAPPDEPAWTEAPALAAPAPASIVVENELRDAVGVTQIPDDKPAKKAKKKRATTDDGDDGERPRSKLWMLAAALAVVLGGTITTMVLVGRSNSERFLIACEADRVVLLQGRSFPPWGESSLDGAEWKPLKIPAEAPCAPFETNSKAELAARFEKMLEERATKLVGGRGGTSTPTSASGPEDPVAKVDEAEAALKQALLVARWLASDNDRITKREDLERLLGDVTYWRASARLRAAADALTDAAKQFDTAALQKPRTNTDAEGWAMHARRLADELRAGPGGEKGAVAFPPMPPSETPTSTAPLGVALPVEPPKEGSAAEPAPPAPDAGVPTGGVLL